MTKIVVVRSADDLPKPSLQPCRTPVLVKSNGSKKSLKAVVRTTMEQVILLEGNTHYVLGIPLTTALPIHLPYSTSLAGITQSTYQFTTEAKAFKEFQNDPDQVYNSGGSVSS
jgi:hypothetical protein